MKTRKIIQTLFLWVLMGTIPLSVFAKVEILQSDPNFTFHGAVSLYQLFKTDADLSGGVKGTVDPYYGIGEITVEVWSDFIQSDNILIYKLVNGQPNSGYYGGQPQTYNDPSSFGPMGDDYPKPWSSDDIKSSALMAKQYFVKNFWSKEVFNDLMGSTMPVVIKVYLKGGSFTAAKIPGIGEFTNDDVGRLKLKFDPMHPVNSGAASSETTQIWKELKILPSGVSSNTVDLKYAAHRGFWGDNLGAGPVENTDPAIQAAIPYTKIIESDVSMTKDGVVVVSHDYNLQRLTDYSGPDPDNTFLYDLNYDEVKNLRLRKRNFDVTDFRFIRLEDLIGYMVKYKTVLTIDVKERARRRDPNTGQCTAACDVNRAKRDQGWVQIFEKILEEAERQNAWSYIAVKTPLTINRIKSLLPAEKWPLMAKILYFPVIQPGVTVEDAVSFINDWYNNGPDYLMGFETNFKTPADLVMNSFYAGDVQYDNILHYVVSKTRYRPGMYPEEPMGPKGIVDRYAQWLFKDLRTDYRGDHIWLMNLPYFPVSILTTDRPDVWQDIKALYNE